MNENLALDRAIADWMRDEGAVLPPEHLLRQVVDSTGRQRPLPRWLALLREPQMRSARVTVVGVRGRRILIAALVVVMTIVTIVGALVVGGQVRLPGAISDDWPGFRGDPARTGVTLRGPVGHPIIAWKHQAGGAAVTTIAIVGDSVFTATDDGTLHSLALASGVERWQAPLDGAGGDVSVVDGVVYVADAAGAVHAFDAADGRERWRVKTAFQAPFDVTVFGGFVYLSGGPDGVLAALDTGNGALDWRANIGHAGRPAWDGTNLYVGADGFFALDPATGQTRWRYETGDDPLGTPAAANGMAYIGAVHDRPYGRLRAIEAATGRLVWETSDPLFSPTVANGVAYSGSGEGEISARDAATGNETWRTLLSGVTREPAFAGGVLYALSEGDSSVYAIDAGGGGELWQLSLDDQLACCIAVAKGYAVVGSYSGTIYAIGGGGTNLTPQPRTTARPSVTPTTTASAGSPVAASDLGSLVWAATAPGERFNWPDAVDVDPSGRAWVADPWDDRFAIFDPDGTFVEYWASPRDGDGRFRLNRPNTDGYGGIAFAADGSFYVLDASSRRVVEFDANRGFTFAWGGFGSSRGHFLDPVALAVGRDGSVYVFDDQRGVVERFTPSGEAVATINVMTNTSGAAFNSGGGLAVDTAGNVYVGQTETNTVAEFLPTGDFARTFGVAESGPQLPCVSAMAVDSEGRLFVTCFGTWVFDASATYIGAVGTSTVDAQLNYGAGLALDGRGNLYAVDAGNVGAGDTVTGELKKFALRLPEP